jgi:hypothetical protein
MQRVVLDRQRHREPRWTVSPEHTFSATHPRFDPAPETKLDLASEFPEALIDLERRWRVEDETEQRIFE